MMVTKVVTVDGREFFCEKGTRVLVEKINEIALTQDMEMSEGQYHAIPASNESAALFE